MLDRRKSRVILFLGVLAALLVVVGAAFWAEQQYCMGVPLISEEELQDYIELSVFDVSKLTLNGERAAADKSSGRIYISQSEEQLAHYSSLQGILASDDERISLYFVRNSALEDVAGSVESGTPLSLVAIGGEVCQRVDVVITTLPVLNMDGVITHKDEENRAVRTGHFTMWAGLDPSTEAYSTRSSTVEWHIRGNTTAGQEKPPWKLAFKNEKGENANLELLGLGRDDDWILNSLTMDDTRIREKLFMDLWNRIAAETDSDLKMSTGEYVEAVINGEYCGLFLLQRRLDGKYLELAEEDVLLKGTDYGMIRAQDAYEFVTPEVNTEEIYAIMQKVLYGTDCSNYNLQNMIDVNLMLQFASARDNFGLKNIYHALIKREDGYEHFLIPWDTDMSFGLIWINDVGFGYDYGSIGDIGFRAETNALRKVYPEYSEAAAERWFYLRQTILLEDQILADIDALCEQLNASGALARDIDLWGNRYRRMDTVEKMKRFVREKLEYLDKYHNRRLPHS